MHDRASVQPGLIDQPVRCSMNPLTARTAVSCASIESVAGHLDRHHGGGFARLVPGKP
jgi:hypothetical protein